jgi:hypothetical protein
MKRNVLTKSALFWVLLTGAGLLFVKMTQQHDAVWIAGMALSLGVLVGGFAWLGTLLWCRREIESSGIVYLIALGIGAFLLRSVLLRIGLANPTAVLCGAAASYILLFTAMRKYQDTFA